MTCTPYLTARDRPLPIVVPQAPTRVPQLLLDPPVGALVAAARHVRVVVQLGRRDPSRRTFLTMSPGCQQERPRGEHRGCGRRTSSCRTDPLVLRAVLRAWRYSCPRRGPSRARLPPRDGVLAPPMHRCQRRSHALPQDSPAGPSQPDVPAPAADGQPLNSRLRARRPHAGVECRCENTGNIRETGEKWKLAPRPVLELN